MNLSLKLILVFAALIVLNTGNAFADPPRASHDHWRNTNYPSHYVLYDGASRTWVETVDCRVFHHFTVLRNELNVLTLFDAGRGMTMQLTYEGMFLKASGEGAFTFYQAGTFDTRTQFEHYDANGAYSGALTKLHACEWVEYIGGSLAYRFVQRLVANDAVEVYDGSRDLTVRMDEGNMYLRQGGAGFSFFKRGRWRR